MSKENLIPQFQPPEGDAFSAEQHEKIHIEQSKAERVKKAENKRKQFDDLLNTAYMIDTKTPEGQKLQKELDEKQKAAKERQAREEKVKEKYESLVFAFNNRFQGIDNSIEEARSVYNSYWPWERLGSNEKSYIRENQSYRDQLMVPYQKFTELWPQARTLEQKEILLSAISQEITRASPDFAKLHAEFKSTEEKLYYAEKALQVSDLALSVAAAYAGPPGIAAALVPKYLVRIGVSLASTHNPENMQTIAWDFIQDVVFAYAGGKTGKAAAQVLAKLGPLGAKITAIFMKGSADGMAKTGMKALLREVADAFVDANLQALFEEGRVAVTDEKREKMTIAERMKGNLVGKVIGKGVVAPIIVKTGLANKIQQIAGKGINSLSPEDFEKIKKQIMSSPDAERPALAEQVLGKVLTPDQHAAIAEAHAVPMKDGQKYSIEELALKMNILKKAGIVGDDADSLLRLGVCGITPLPPPPRRSPAPKPADATPASSAASPTQQNAPKPIMAPPPPPRRGPAAAPSVALKGGPKDFTGISNLVNDAGVLLPPGDYRMIGSAPNGSSMNFVRIVNGVPTGDVHIIPKRNFFQIKNITVAPPPPPIRPAKVPTYEVKVKTPEGTKWVPNTEYDPGMQTSMINSVRPIQQPQAVPAHVKMPAPAPAPIKPPAPSSAPSAKPRLESTIQPAKTSAPNPRSAERRAKNKTQREDPEYWKRRGENISKRQGETPIDDGLGVLVKKKTLYHGSPTPDIKQFRLAGEVTAGEGVYFTSEPIKGIGYAKVRENTFKTNTPTLYEASIENAKLLDLRKAENVNKILPEFGKFLQEKITPTWSQLDPNNQMRYRRILSAAYEIGGNAGGRLHEIGSGAPKELSEFAKSRGYDGLVTLEGGEHSGAGFAIGEHDSYVIFDPTKIKMNRSQHIKDSN